MIYQFQYLFVHWFVPREQEIFYDDHILNGYSMDSRLLVHYSLTEKQFGEWLKDDLVSI